MHLALGMSQNSFVAQDEDGALATMALLSAHHDEDMDMVVKDFLNNFQETSYREAMQKWAQDRTQVMPERETIVLSRDENSLLHGKKSCFKASIDVNAETNKHQIELVVPYGFAVFRVPHEIVNHPKYGQKGELFLSHVSRAWRKHHDWMQTNTTGMQQLTRHKPHVDEIVGGGEEVEETLHHADVPQFFGDPGAISPKVGFESNSYWPATLGDGGFIALVEVKSMQPHHRESTRQTEGAHGAQIHRDYYVVVKASPDQVIHHYAARMGMKLHKQVPTVGEMMAYMGDLKNHVILNIERLIVQFLSVLDMPLDSRYYKTVSMKNDSGHHSGVLALNTDAVEDDAFEVLLINMPHECDMKMNGKMVEFQKNLQSIQGTPDKNLGIGSRYIMVPQSKIEPDSTLFYRINQDPSRDVLLPTIQIGSKTFINSITPAISEEDLNLSDKSTVILFKNQ